MASSSMGGGATAVSSTVRVASGRHVATSRAIQPRQPLAVPRRVGWLRVRQRRRGVVVVAGAVDKDPQGRNVNWVRESDLWESDSSGDGEAREGVSLPGGKVRMESSLDEGEFEDYDIEWSEELLRVREKLEALKEAVGLSESLAPIDYGGSAEDFDLDAMSALRTQVDRLKAVVFKQRETIRQLQNTVAAAQLQSAAASPDSPSTTEEPPVNGHVFPSSFSSSPSKANELRLRPYSPASSSNYGPSRPPPISDRRMLGGFDARFHSTSAGATPADYRVLPARIILVRHGESFEDDMFEYSEVPDPRIPLTESGRQQAREAGARLRSMFGAAYAGKPYRTFFYTSPYLRSSQTFQCLREAMFDPPVAPGESPPLFAGMREEVQLREQDFGNFQDPGMRMRKRSERKRFGRFFYRFPNGESGADLYDRITIFQDHLVRDINAGRFSQDTNLVLVTHGLALRVFLMRWFHWTVDELLGVINPPHASTMILERIPSEQEARPDGPVAWMHTKALYRLSPESRDLLEGCTDEMCSATSPLLLSVKTPPSGTPKPRNMRDR